MSLPRHLSARQIAVQLNCSYHAALKIMRRAGALKIGSLVRVPEDRLASYLDQCRDTVAPMFTSDQGDRDIGPSLTVITNTSPSAKIAKRLKRSSPRCSGLADFSNWRPAKKH
jgi:hypothetical protein